MRTIAEFFNNAFMWQVISMVLMALLIFYNVIARVEFKNYEFQGCVNLIVEEYLNATKNASNISYP